MARPKKEKEVNPEQLKVEEPKEKPIVTSLGLGLKKVKLTKEQLLKVQAEGKLVDWNSETKEAVIKD